MTTTQQILDLINSNTDLKGYYEGIRADIEARMQAAQSAFPGMHRVLYVNEATGDDTNSGSASSPVATLERAINLVPINGSGGIYLQSNVTLQPGRRNIERKDVQIFGHLGPNGTASIKATAFVEDGYAYLSGWNCVGLNSGIMLRHCRLEFPQYTGSAPAHDRYSSLIGNIAGFQKSICHFAASNCDMVYPTSHGFGYCATSTSNMLIFLINSNIDVNGNMSGHYVQGANPSNPNSAPTLITNLNSL